MKVIVLSKDNEIKFAYDDLLASAFAQREFVATNDSLLKALQVDHDLVFIYTVGNLKEHADAIQLVLDNAKCPVLVLYTVLDPTHAFEIDTANARLYIIEAYEFSRNVSKILKRVTGQK